MQPAANAPANWTQARLALVGLPGSGKSTVGQQLARRLELPFVDSDRVIEDRIGCSIRTFFEQQGEAAFRDVEEAVLGELAGGSPAVIATGGGAVLRPVNRARLQRHCYVVYLHTSPEHVHQRLRHDRQRPLLQVDDPLARLTALFAQRDPLYREVAHHVIDVGRSRVAQVVNLLHAQLVTPGAGAL